MIELKRGRAPQPSTVTISRRLSPVQVHAGTMTASDKLKLSSDAEVFKVGVTYVKVKEFYVRIPGTYRMKFDLKTNIAGGGAHGKIYLNGSAHGTERINNSETYVTFSEDLRADDGDLIQLYLEANVTKRALAQNFRLYGTVAIGAGVENAV